MVFVTFMEKKFVNKIDKISPLENPKFVKPIKIDYTNNGKKKVWEAVIAHDSVAILLYHIQKKEFVLVKQLRIPVLNANKTNGMMYELCAGIVDKKISNIKIAQEEILEECGYDVPLQNIEKVSSFYTSVGISGTLQTLYFAAIDDSMKKNDGGGLEEEDIEVIYLPIAKAKKFILDESYQKTPGMMMAIYWFFSEKKHKDYV